MAFEKGSLGDNQKVKDYTDGFEDRVDKAFGEMKDYVIDFGFNAKGHWEKWESGKLVQWGMSKDFTLATATFQTGDYPIPFYSTPSCSMSIHPVAISGDTYSFLGKIGQVQVFSRSATDFAIFTRNTPTGSEVGRAYVSAVGRWK